MNFKPISSLVNSGKSLNTFFKAADGDDYLKQKEREYEKLKEEVKLQLTVKRSLELGQDLMGRSTNSGNFKRKKKDHHSG